TLTFIARAFIFRHIFRLGHLPPPLPPNKARTIKYSLLHNVEPWHKYPRATTHRSDRNPMPEAELTAQHRSDWHFFRRQEGEMPSLSEVNASVAVPGSGNWMRRLFAFMGPGYMV